MRLSRLKVTDVKNGIGLPSPVLESRRYFRTARVRDTARKADVAAIAKTKFFIYILSAREEMITKMIFFFRF